jgi:hypothetical protein
MAGLNRGKGKQFLTSVATGRSAGVDEEVGMGSTTTKGKTVALVEEAGDAEVAGVLGYGGSSSSSQAAPVFAAGGAPSDGSPPPSPSHHP